MGFTGGSDGKEPACHCRRCKRCGLDPRVGKIPRRGEWLPTPVFLPGESQGHRRLVGYSPWDRKESDTTEPLTHCPSNSVPNLPLKCESVSRSVMSDYSPPGSSVRGILQARILKWLAIPYSRRSSQSRDQTRVPRSTGRFFTI